MKEENLSLDDVEPKELIKAILHRKIAISDVPTFMLCDELERRAGVRATYVAPYETTDIRVDGSALVYVVTD